MVAVADFATDRFFYFMFNLSNILVFVVVDTDGKIIAVGVDTGGQKIHFSILN
jgi:hypothetical protein